jgi:hypothetical protein
MSCAVDTQNCALCSTNLFCRLSQRVSCPDSRKHHLATVGLSRRIRAWRNLLDVIQRISAWISKAWYLPNSKNHSLTSTDGVVHHVKSTILKMYRCISFPCCEGPVKLQYCVQAFTFGL